MFDLNDFDETLPGPWEWDVKRLAVSMLIAAQNNAFKTKVQEQVVLDTVESYRSAMVEFAGKGNLDVWYARLEIEKVLQEYGDQLQPSAVKKTEKRLAKAQTKD